METFMALGAVVYFAMLPLMLIGFFVYSSYMNTVYCCLGLLLYSLFLIIDTQMIVGGKSMNGYECDLDDYVTGAMMLYLDIIMIFVYLLKLLGSKDE
jgi:FtsH-binding integral membrane protein